MAESVFYDLAETPDEAANHTARGLLMTAIEQRIREEGWTQTEAAARLRVTQPRVSDLLNGKVSKFSLDALVNMLASVGLTFDVRPVEHPPEFCNHALRTARKATYSCVMTTSSSAPISLDALIDHVQSGLQKSPALDRLTRSVDLSSHLGDLGDALVSHFVDESRREGATWGQIGERLGVTRQAVQKRFLPDDGSWPSFWDRATPALRKVASTARQEAQRRRKTYLGTEHLLLAILANSDDPATTGLSTCGASAETVRAAVNGRIGIPTGEPLADETPFTRLALTSLQHASREALRADSTTIDTGHLLLGLITVGDGLAHDVLTALGIGYEPLRDAIRKAAHR